MAQGNEDLNKKQSKTEQVVQKPLAGTKPTVSSSAEVNKIVKKAKQSLTPKKISDAYGVGEEVVSIIPYPVVNSLKITFPRKYISGSIFDNDVYGCQQHIPLGNIEVE